MKAVVPADPEFEEAFASARVSKTWLARYYLRSLEKTFKQLPHPEYIANEDVQDVNLEHVMPLEPNDNWNVDPAIAQSAQKFLGNMALLREPDNRDLGNKGWDKKKAVLGKSGYELTKMIGKYKGWDLADIKDRQKKLAKLAVKTWTLNFND
jgi:hypothetical protein